MTVVAIYGNPKKGGFVHECVDHVGAHLRGKGEDVQELRLAEKNVLDCSGCFSCLKTGRCESDDDMNDIRSTLREAAGFVVGASVRNGFFPALYKKFYERICYPIGFTRDLRDKPVLAIGAVGLAGGKKMLKTGAHLPGVPGQDGEVPLLPDGDTHAEACGGCGTEAYRRR